MTRFLCQPSLKKGTSVVKISYTAAQECECSQGLWVTESTVHGLKLQVHSIILSWYRLIFSWRHKIISDKDQICYSTTSWQYKGIANSKDDTFLSTTVRAFQMACLLLFSWSDYYICLKCNTEPPASTLPAKCNRLTTYRDKYPCDPDGIEKCSNRFTSLD